MILRRPKNLKKLERLTKIVFDLFPPEVLKEYERDGVSIQEQFMEYCIKNTFTCPINRPKRTIEDMAIFVLHDFLKSGPKEEFQFDIFDVFFF